MFGRICKRRNLPTRSDFTLAVSSGGRVQRVQRRLQTRPWRSRCGSPPSAVFNTTGPHPTIGRAKINSIRRGSTATVVTNRCEKGQRAEVAETRPAGRLLATTSRPNETVVYICFSFTVVYHSTPAVWRNYRTESVEYFDRCSKLGTATERHPRRGHVRTTFQADSATSLPVLFFSRTRRMQIACKQIIQ